MDSKYILELSQVSMAKALQIAEEVKGLVWGFAVSDLIYQYGAEVIYELKFFGNVMADIRLLTNIPSSAKILRSAGAALITVAESAKYIPKGDESEFLVLVKDYSRIYPTQINDSWSDSWSDLVIIDRSLILLDDFAKMLA